jgi:5'-3' exonuclease
VGGGVRASLPDGGAMSASVAAAIEVALIDLSSIAYPIWHVSGSEPDQDFCSRQIVARVRALTRTYPHAAICCDSGRSFRNDLSPAYKANRPPAEASLKHQIRLAEEQLAADGFPVWKVKGYEADDLIASGARLAVEAGASVLVVSGDKDLMQLVSGDVRVLSPASNTTYDAEAVRVKFGVRPEQIRDYLTLVGDAADNVKGAAGIGPKRAADLLSKWGTLEGVYEALDQHGTQFTPAIATALRNFQAELVTVRALITLDHAVEIPFGEVMAPRVPKAGPQLEDIDMSESVNTVTGEIVETAAPEPVTPEPAAAPEPVEAPKAEAPQPATSKPANGNGAPKDPIEALAADRGALVPASYEKQLEPQTLGQAAQLAKAMFLSNLFGAGYGNQHAVLSTILAGRELGLQAMASLRAFHIVEGKHQLSADFIRALVLKSGLVEYFRCTERTAERATFTIKRKGDPEMSLTYTIAEAQAAGLVKAKSGWEKNPADMLTARASSKLARLVCPEVVFGLYAPEEFEN